MQRESKKPEDLMRLENIASNLKFRSSFLFYLRKFFIKKGFLEIDTPVLIRSPAPEDYINAPPVGGFFLRTSPELHMKRLAAAGFSKFFQLGPCFREGERGKLHNVEFTMLEWYEAGRNYEDLMEFVKEMLQYTIKRTCGKLKITYGKNIIDFEGCWEVITVKEAFLKHAGILPETAIQNNEFEIILTEKVEPNLPRNRPVFLSDYPVSLAALSKVKSTNQNVAERWELYLGGIEIANTYSELTAYNEQKKRFRKAHKNRKLNNLPEYPEDNDFFEAMKYGIPELAGSALGIDRLIMILTDSSEINEVISFTET
ncbi:MAG: EF-P lysine aminoacylase GenX [Victivallales bacterium]|nr:EF-P lysine aminoacylase GenX [Victivallales bacterium]MCF7889384.1 EF-P lysine aminoacylase GenX [Victivallales bacterium]